MKSSGTRWKWERSLDADGHPQWLATIDGYDVAVIWRSGGDSGEYLLEDGSRYSDLASAKKAAREKWDD
jgi:hypothetical protein